MIKKVNMNNFLHYLHVIKEMNDFTVTESRGVLLKEHKEFTDKTETKKIIYRKLRRNIGKGRLKHSTQLSGFSKKFSLNPIYSTLSY